MRSFQNNNHRQLFSAGRAVSFLLLSIIFVPASPKLLAEIPQPDDAPAPLSPKESARAVQVPPGFLFEFVAGEPMVQDPTGVCWDEHGQLFVSELHGYNLEGQFDIEELNKTGKLDRKVRRIRADEEAKEAAEKIISGRRTERYGFATPPAG